MRIRTRIEQLEAAVAARSGGEPLMIRIIRRIIEDRWGPDGPIFTGQVIEREVVQWPSAAA